MPVVRSGLLLRSPESQSGRPLLRSALGRATRSTPSARPYDQSLSSVDEPDLRSYWFVRECLGSDRPNARGGIRAMEVVTGREVAGR